MVARIGLKGAKPARIYFKEWRDWKGWTQQELADRLETTVATVSRIENGERDWGKGYLEAFSHVIGCDNPSDPITRPPDQPSADHLLREATKADREKVWAVIRALLKTG